MQEQIKAILQNRYENHILPFFWQHGEEEQVLREYMNVIADCHIGAVCVESRPHPDFVGEKWWRDMDIILEEAVRRNMKVWILDDSHFPTGYANGAVEKAPLRLRRRGICYQGIPAAGKRVRISVDRFLRRQEKKEGIFDKLTGSKKKNRSFPKDELLSITAFRVDGVYKFRDLTDQVKGGILSWTPPEGKWKIGLCKLCYHCGMHENYINMMDEDSCRILIDTVYEPHYEHYKQYFGSTIAGFFSDEPELGNGPLYCFKKQLGTPVDEPWSDTLIPLLEKSMGSEWKNKLPLIWENNADTVETARVRYAYMDAVTRKVQQAFSFQIGDWCRTHGVQYIGHVIEDNNLHSRSGSSLGHYFRALSGQDMAGIDDIGGQVNPQQEDGPDRYFMFMPRDGEFFHYSLGKLAGSLAAVDPGKHGNAMCEIFGNYGWSEGFRLEKYLADHFMVRGVNYFVPHAFSPKAFPDIDCPPHFYAHGRNPQYRHFSALMDYMNRVSNLISGGRHVASVAILYHGEADWAGEAMMMQKPARRLLDAQIDFDFIPVDVFTEREYYHTSLNGEFRVHNQVYRVLIIPWAQFISEHLADAVEELRKIQIPVYFIQALPNGIYDGVSTALKKVQNCKVVSLEQLVNELERISVPQIRIAPQNNRIRAMHYSNGYEMFYFVNEGTETYRGTVTVPASGTYAAYCAERNRLEQVSGFSDGISTTVKVEIETRQSLILLFDSFSAEEIHPALEQEIRKGKELDWDCVWQRSICTSQEYPEFGKKKEVQLPDVVSEELPKFSGMIRYENSITLSGTEEQILLEITNAWEGVEVFVNGISAGIQIVPTYRFDLTGLVKAGINQITIDVSTTLERERRAGRESILELLQHQKTMSPTGITGKVRIFACGKNRKE